MGLFSSLFKRSFPSAFQRADELHSEGRLGEAKLAFEQALELATGEHADQASVIRERLRLVRDELAEGHLEEGDRCAAEGLQDRARESYEAAVEVASSTTVRDEARRRIDSLEAADARAAFEEAQELSEIDRYAALSGMWEEARAFELESYGDRFREAFLMLHDGDTQGAVSAMEQLLEEHEDAIYLRLELGLALHAAGRPAEAIERINQFLERLDEPSEDDEEEDDEEEEEEGGAARVQAHHELAQLFADARELDAAEEQLRRLVELLPEKSDPYVLLGQFLRGRGKAKEALEVLEEGRLHMGELHPDMRVVREIGLTQAALDDRAAAITSLQACVDFDAALGRYDFDPLVVVPLAELLAGTGETQRAADLYRHLAAGTHAQGHFVYNLKAGKLLVELRQHDVARRYLSRALELAPDDEAREAVDRLAAKLPPQEQGN